VSLGWVGGVGGWGGYGGGKRRAYCWA
jgi:hypothetical protein